MRKKANEQFLNITSARRMDAFLTFSHARITLFRAFPVSTGPFVLQAIKNVKSLCCTNRFFSTHLVVFFLILFTWISDSLIATYL